MHRLLVKGHQNIESHKLLKAIRCYKKAAHKKHGAAQDKEVALYMLAYVHILSEHQARHSEWSALGVDLKHPYFHAYDKAAHYLEQIHDQQFSPEAYNLPLIDQFDWQQIQELSGHQFAWQNKYF